MEVAFEMNARNARRRFDAHGAAGTRTLMRRETSAGTEFNSTYYSYAADNSMLRRREQFSGIDTYFYYDANGALTEMVDGVDATYFTYGANHLVRRIEIPVSV